MTRSLGHTVWTDHWRPTRRPLLAVPVGSCEQHGPHLPLDTDIRIATALAYGLSDKYDEGEVLVPRRCARGGGLAGYAHVGALRDFLEANVPDLPDRAPPIEF